MLCQLHTLIPVLVSTTRPSSNVYNHSNDQSNDRTVYDQQYSASSKDVFDKYNKYGGENVIVADDDNVDDDDFTERVVKKT